MWYFMLKQWAMLSYWKVFWNHTLLQSYLTTPKAKQSLQSATISPFLLETWSSSNLTLGCEPQAITLDQFCEYFHCVTIYVCGLFEQNGYNSALNQDGAKVTSILQNDYILICCRFEISLAGTKWQIILQIKGGEISQQ